jgi:hypothetical protein
MAGPGSDPARGGEAVIGPVGNEPGAVVTGAVVPRRTDPGATHPGVAEPEIAGPAAPIPGGTDVAPTVPGGAPLGAMADGNWTRWPKLVWGLSQQPNASRTPRMIGVFATGAPEEWT